MSGVTSQRGRVMQNKQVRFIRAVIPPRWTETELSGLRKAVFAANSQIKFIAFTKTSPVKGLVILAQAQDKLTAMRWRQHLGHRLQVLVVHYYGSWTSLTCFFVL